MSFDSEQYFPIGRRINSLAKEHPDKTAIVFIPEEGAVREIKWLDLDRFSNQVARLLADYGVDNKSKVVVGLKNCPEHIIMTIAIWKLGACFIPLRAQLPEEERNALIELVDPKLVVADWEGVAVPKLTVGDLEKARSYDGSPLPECLPQPTSGLASGGSTGRPKIIFNPNPVMSYNDAPYWFGLSGQKPGQVQIVVGPLYHTGPYWSCIVGLTEDHTIVLMEHFDAARCVDLIEQYRVNCAFMVPTHMQRIAKLPSIKQRDLSSIKTITHAAAPCPPWVKKAWIDLIGGEKITEFYGMTEAIGSSAIRGDEWLKHPGSVGKPFFTVVEIRDFAGNVLPVGTVGEIFMKNPDRPISYQYVGAAASSSPDGFNSVGDLGYIDEEGYLYISDRRQDLIVTGGANVYPAEVEVALSEHPEITDVVVIGLPDDDWGKRVHAIIQPNRIAQPPNELELDKLCRSKLAAYKVPKSYEFIAELPRTAAGKIRRIALIEERVQAI